MDFDLLFLQNNSDICDGGKNEKNHGILLHLWRFKTPIFNNNIYAQ
jgi:hypothetical protein